ncbi:MAG: peptide chain release factor N(5)-glutamine methyltransferase [Pseudomonadota bacterium]
MMNTTLTQALTWATQLLSQLPEATPRLEAEMLLAHALGKERTHLIAWPDKALSPDQEAAFRALVEQRAQGIPVAYLLKEREFWSLPLLVSPDTLIPRPETELLVELALARIPLDAAWRIADLGTGTGAIALALASERPRCRLIAIDRSSGALAVARANAERLGIRNIEFLTGDWLAPLHDETLEMIVSNPPYIAADDPHLTRGDVRFEPRSALASGPDGLDDIRIIVATARAHLKSGGALLIEHGYQQGAAVVALMQSHGYQRVEDHRDYAGHGRVAAGHKE